MKKFVTALLLVLASSIALALPSPKDIEAAVKAGQLSQAEAMLHEVVKEKPASAKARYELGQVLAREGKNGEARRELLEAQRLDPALKFASDPQRFHDFLNRLPAATPAPVAKPSERANLAVPAAPPAAPSFPWAYVLLGGGALAAVWLLLRRTATASRMPLPVAGGGSATAATGYGYGVGGGNPGYGTPGYGVPPAPAAGSGIGGAVVGGLAGMAAGYGLAKILEGNHEEHPSRQLADDNGFIPIEPAQPDYGAFDAGSGGSDSWDGGDAGSGDDSW